MKASPSYIWEHNLFNDFDTTMFYVILWQSVLSMEETGVSWENYRHKVVFGECDHMNRKYKWW